MCLLNAWCCVYSLFISWKPGPEPSKAAFSMTWNEARTRPLLKTYSKCQSHNWNNMFPCQIMQCQKEVIIRTNDILLYDSISISFCLIIHNNLQFVNIISVFKNIQKKLIFLHHNKISYHECLYLCVLHDFTRSKFTSKEPT